MTFFSLFFTSSYNLFFVVQNLFFDDFFSNVMFVHFFFNIILFKVAWFIIYAREFNSRIIIYVLFFSGSLIIFCHFFLFRYRFFQRQSFFKRIIILDTIRHFILQKWTNVLSEFRFFKLNRIRIFFNWKLFCRVSLVYFFNKKKHYMIMQRVIFVKFTIFKQFHFCWKNDIQFLMKHFFFLNFRF